MKRSEMVKSLEESFKDTNIDADLFLTNLEVVYGLKPPPIPVKFVREPNYPYGGGCTMRCNCEECNPDFLVNEWELE